MTEISPGWRWIMEWHTPYEAHLYGIKKVYFIGKTKFQTVEIVEVYDYGKCLFIDGKLQSSQVDEWIYHEALVHPAMITHPNPKKVAILGGGEGATLREVLRYDVEKVVMIDIDREIVELCKKYLPEWHQGSFDDPRVKLVIEDARKYLEETNEIFDVIIIDLTDPVPGCPSVKLYTREFYEIVYKRLSSNGVMVTQATSAHIPRCKNYAIIYNTIRQIFPVVRAYRVFVPSFVSPWGFVLGSKENDPLRLDSNYIKDRISKIKGKLKFYDEEVHRALFILPKYLRRILDETKEVATDDNPVYLPI